MRTLYALLLALPCAAFGQNTIQVEVGGSLVGATAPYYSPQNITINVGDIVQWNNVSGSHNVTGTTQLFPGNPESFSSGSVAGGPWTYSFTFTIPGEYDYHCTAGGHSATQFGRITVVNTTGVEESAAQDEVAIFPVPTQDLLTVELGSLRVRTAEVFSLNGKRIANVAVNGRSRVDVNTAHLAPGNYFLRLMAEDGNTVTRPFRRE